jgi:hypothetical protein
MVKRGASLRVKCLFPPPWAPGKNIRRDRPLPGVNLYSVPQSPGSHLTKRFNLGGEISMEGGYQE